VEIWKLQQLLRSLNPLRCGYIGEYKKKHVTEHVTNNEIIRRLSKELEIVENVKTRKLQYLGHVIWGEKRHIEITTDYIG